MIWAKNPQRNKEIDSDDPNPTARKHRLAGPYPGRRGFGATIC